MKSKKAKILFMFFANIILLANISIPQQYVDGISSIFHFHLHTQNIPHEHNTGDEHEENAHGHAHIYLVKQVAQINRSSISAVASITGDPNPLNLFLSPVTIPFFVDDLKICDLFPEIPPEIYKDPINDGVELRGPPLV
jgi:hypothetical protein